MPGCVIFETRFYCVVYVSLELGPPASASQVPGSQVCVTVPILQPMSWRNPTSSRGGKTVSVEQQGSGQRPKQPGFRVLRQETSYRKRTLGSPCSLWGAGGGGCGRSIQDGCHETAQVWTTETARVSSQGGLAQGRRVKEGQDPRSGRVCGANRTRLPQAEGQTLLCGAEPGE